jgi:hypothetical protein
MSRYALLAVGLSILLWMSRPLFPAYLLSLGVPDAAIVTILAGPMLVEALFGAPIGRLADRLGFHAVVAAGAVVTGLWPWRCCPVSRAPWWQAPRAWRFWPASERGTPPSLWHWGGSALHGARLLWLASFWGSATRPSAAGGSHRLADRGRAARALAATV